MQAGSALPIIGRRRRRASMLAPTCAGGAASHRKAKTYDSSDDMRPRLDLRQGARTAPKSRTTAELQNHFGLGACCHEKASHLTFPTWRKQTAHLGRDVCRQLPVIRRSTSLSCAELLLLLLHYTHHTTAPSTHCHCIPFDYQAQA